MRQQVPLGQHPHRVANNWVVQRREQVSQGDGSGPSECNKYHSDSTTVVALLTGWYNRGSRCLKDITIHTNGRRVNAVVVDDRDSTMQCDDNHDYQPPCPNDIDATKAMWEVLGVPCDSCGKLDITWTDA